MVLYLSQARGTIIEIFKLRFDSLVSGVFVLVMCEAEGSVRCACMEVKMQGM